MEFVTIKKLVKQLREDYDIDEDKYPNVYYTTDNILPSIIGEHIDKFEEQEIISYEFNPRTKKKWVSEFNLQTDKCVFASISYPSMDMGVETIGVAFANSYEDVKDIISVDGSIYYKPGNYQIEKGMAGYSLEEINLIEEQAPILNNNQKENIITDIEKFFEKEDFYRENDMPFKRGILLYGPPGNGKTSLIKTIIKEHSDDDIYSLIIDANNISSGLNEFFDTVLKNKKKILVIEDIDGISAYERSAVLNFMDGINTLENTFIIATTNYLGKVDEALVNRPSRFDKLYNVRLPNKNSRKKLLQKFFPDLSGEELESAVRKTNGFSGAYFKELFIYHNLHEEPIVDCIKSLKKQMELLQNQSTEMFG